MSGEWIENKGDVNVCPVKPGQKVAYRFRYHIDEGMYEDGRIDDYDAVKDFYWNIQGRAGDIMVYKIIGEPEKDVDTNFKETNPKDAIGIRKAPLSVLPMAVLAEVGTGMLEGASKYGRHNWRGAGIRGSVYFDATIRHLFSWWEGEDIDPDSDLSHVTKAICSLMVLRDAMIQEMYTDDRPPRSKPFYEALNAQCGKILEKHSDKNPKHWTIADSSDSESA